MMTIDDEGEGGLWSMMTSSQKSKFCVNFWDFTRNFSKFPPIFQNFQKFFQKSTDSEQNFSSKFEEN